MRPLLVAILLIVAGPGLGQSTVTLNISPASVSFPKLQVGSQSAPLTVTLSNPASSTIQLQEIIISGIDFAQSNDCEKELASGAKCSIQIVFKPATSGERLGNLEIIASDRNVPHFVALTGAGE
jgi:Transmembrane protein 131-like N-terminal